MILDDRFLLKHQQIDLYETMYGEFENGIMEFEIIDSSKVNDEHYRFIVIETYFDGYKAQTPVDVKKLGDRWRIVIKDDVSEESFRIPYPYNNYDQRPASQRLFQSQRRNVQSMFFLTKCYDHRCIHVISIMSYVWSYVIDSPSQFVCVFVLVK